MLKNILKNKFLLVICLLIVWLVPNTISVPEQSRTETIVIAVGVDKDKDEYEVSLQYIIPHASTSSESLNLISEKGKSVDECIQKINKELGKFSGFAHCRVIAFNDEACEYNTTQILDSLLRKKTNTNNIVLISTPKSAKDLLTTSNNLDSNLYTFLNNSAFSNELRGYEDLTSIGDYYDCFFGFCKCLKVNIIEVEESKESSSGDGSGGGSENSEQESGSGSGGGGQSKDKGKKLKNEGKLLIIKNEKKLISLSKEESENLNWFNKNVEKMHFEIKNISDEYLKNANLTFNVSRKEVSYKPYFKDGTPNMDVKVKVHLNLVQILSEKITQENYKINHDFLTNKVNEEISKSILEKLTQAENNFKQNKYDVLSLEEMFYKFCNKEYKAYTNSKLENRYFLEDVNFNYYVEIVKGE